MRESFISFVLLLLLTCCLCRNTQRITNRLDAAFSANQYMGLTLQITERGQTIYKYNNGLSDYSRNIGLDDRTVFRMASLSKSPTSVGLMQLHQQGLFKLTDDVSSILGFILRNPNFPDHSITVEMILSHQSSFKECDAYYNFLHTTYTGPPFPQLRDLLLPGGKYYDLCLFGNQFPPGQYYEYVNYNYAIAATLLQRLSNQRFDMYMSSHVFQPLKMTSTSYKREDFISEANRIAVLYRANSNGTWQPQADDWKGVIVPRDLSQYVIGTNGAVFSPMGGLYSTSADLTRYMIMLQQAGIIDGVRIFSENSCREMTRPRYRFHGNNKATNSSEHSYNAYGLGIQTSTYDKYVEVFPHQVVKGHWGDSYGLISQYAYTRDYTYVYAINGARYGYHELADSFYEKERIELHQIIYQYLLGIDQVPHLIQE